MFKFKTINQNDLTLIYQWFQEPSINQWYARGKPWSLEAIREKYEPRILGQENVPSFIIYKDETPIGFIQYYQLEHGVPESIILKQSLPEQSDDDKELMLDLLVTGLVLNF
jgi:aminoglycoside 6'-N-acetyltransferase